MVADDQLLFPRPSAEEVLSHLTDFFFTKELQNQASDELRQRKAVIERLRQTTKNGVIDTGRAADIIQSSEDALNTLISLLGLSQERFLGIVCISELPGKPAGQKKSMTTLIRLAMRDRAFAEGLSALLIGGSSAPDLKGRVPPFDLQKLDPRKLLLEENALIDSLLRLGLKGRFDAKKGGNPGRPRRGRSWAYRCSVRSWRDPLAGAAAGSGLRCAER
jgi:hypothetical protein